MVAFNWMEVEVMQGGKGKREGGMYGMKKIDIEDPEGRIVWPKFWQGVEHG